MPEDAETVCGWDFERGRDLDGLLDAMLRTGFQATALGRAANEVNRMVRRHACLSPSALPVLCRCHHRLITCTDAKMYC